MARKRNPVTDGEFYASLNSQNDLQAITHGHQRIVDTVDAGVEILLRNRSLSSESIQRLGIEGQVDVLVLADRLDADLRAIIGHLTKVRHRFVHGYGHEFTKAEGDKAWELLPQRSKNRKPTLLDLGRPGQVIRFCIVMVHTRVLNRAVYLHGPDLPE